MKHKMKDQDVYIWSYKSTEGMFEPYHCKSRIGIFSESNNALRDTFWGNLGNNGKWFSLEECKDLIDLKYLGNLNDYTPARETDQAMYDDKDFLNLNHSNRSKGNCYVRKGAVKSKEKMVKIIKRNARQKKREYEWAKMEYERELEMLNNIDTLEYVFANEGVSLADDSYEDGEILGESQ